jgi:hypothetical protein
MTAKVIFTWSATGTNKNEVVRLAPGIDAVSLGGVSGRAGLGNFSD